MSYISQIKFLPIFALTCALGIVFVNSTDVKVPKKDFFTWEEAVARLDKRVESICNAKNIRSEDTTGRTAFVDKDDFNGGYYVVIDWEYSLRGRHEIFHTNKATYEKCIIEVEDAAY